MKNRQQDKLKKTGRFYTPEFIVKNVLDMAGYYGENILCKHVIDNSCGDGAFLIEIVNRYCDAFLSFCTDLHRLSVELSTYIHGIEIDKSECDKCIYNLNEAIKAFGVNDVTWDIVNADALDVDRFDGKIDFVLGNPPYVRVHNLGDSYNKIKDYTFAKNGMTDLYIVFFEIGIKMLNANGVLAYITPSSYFNSVAAQFMRNYLIVENLTEKIEDLKHYQAFNATTYTAITVLKRNKTDTYTDYYGYDDKKGLPYFVDRLKASDYFINGNFYFGDENSLAQLRRVLCSKRLCKRFEVKNGFATLADDFFIGDFDFEKYTIPIVKASTGKTYKCFYPYRNGKLIPYRELISDFRIKSYIENNEVKLKKRSLDKKNEWYGFGRSQGIGDVGRNKYAVNTLIKSTSDIKITKCVGGVGVYGGLYILTDIEECELRDMLISNDFISYIAMLAKYKSGGYYTFSSKDLEKFLEYKYMQKRGMGFEQQSIFGYS